ncbi:tetracycline resistance transcriptional repressor TetR [Pandoraea nosoerga]|nr:tetracycline resistance transcriptional repressor TetR [Pandoraea nosoerga]MBN4666732.1 tetracycline resistance transcriptional repressor TetR [Pandoraea nosoerga]MBN4676880.1 tetracycline resistance transcriptional repressor TetR [Pandoraea nosoerga]MBN4681513.1 tetracycline resistance transcriptional repressor TetR [Pandoraea nosoerga]MBN4745999.1 tetracycline resistance transcriptional repressor TetR [Pandoraea nosoerga]
MKDATPPRLSRDAVMQAALALLNEAGIDALSTRRLAERLGVQSPTLYWHFKNKAELLEAMAEAIMLERHVQTPPGPGERWQDWLVANAHSFRRALLAYRDGARLHAGTRPRPAQLGNIEAKTRVLCEAGFTPDQAIGLMIAISRFVVGWVLEEQASSAAPANAARGEDVDAKAYPLLRAGWSAFDAQDPDQAFDDHVRLFVTGAERRLGKAPSRR